MSREGHIGPPEAAAILVIAAFLQYARTLGIGLLADDFVLYEWAQRGTPAPASWPYLRPLHVALWSMSIGGDLSRDAVILRTLSALVHGANGALLAGLGRTLGLTGPQALASGAFFVCFPTSVEAVAWPSAFGDVLSTCCLLLSLTVLCRVSSPWRSVALSTLLASGALLSKESALAAPVLFLVFAGLGGQRSRRRATLVTAAVAAALAVSYLVGRAATGRWPPHPGVTWQDMGAVLTRPFIVLAFPFHEDLIARWPMIPIAWILLLGAAAVAARPHATPDRRWIAAPLWIVASVGPTAGLFSIGSDLQGGRYLYLAAAAWTLVLAWILVPSHAGHHRRAVRLTACGALLALAAAATWEHQRHWVQAATLRDIVLSNIAELPAECRRVFVVAAPDNLRGAYVARNGLPEAIRLIHGRHLEFVHAASDALPQCRLDFTAFAGARVEPGR